MKRNDSELVNTPTAPDIIAKAGGSAKAAVASKVSAAEEWLLQRLMSLAGSPAIEMALYGQTVYKPATEPVARLNVSDSIALLKLMINPDLQFGELYSAQRLQVEGDLVELMIALNSAIPDFNQRNIWYRWLGKLYLLRRNTLSRARGNIHHHYDISNEFYQLWLDQRMLYTCAYFSRPDVTLEEAQLAKMDYVSRKLRLKPDEEVVEAGCGWGALALHMAKHYGVKVKAYNISKEQIAYARECARAEGMQDRVEYIEGDYRMITGQFDAFMSVGMLEHVGRAHYHELGAVIDRCLKPNGRGLIHSIGRNRPSPVNAWIAKRIFPGGYTPSPGEIAAVFEPWRFSVLDMENLRLHYAVTLRHWLARFDGHADKITAMFDEAFVRAWRLYLAGSVAAFHTGELQLFQVVFTRHHNNEIPWTRDFLYTEQE